MKLTLAFSPCPNDTFIFDALINKKIDTRDFEFEVLLEDVQTLNQLALQNKIDVSKISYGVLPLITDDYFLLNSGGALGKGVGPLLIAKTELQVEDLADKKIAIPGENTTAHMLFTLAFPNAKNKVFKVFNEIEDAVLNGEVDAGVIIHENRFTYQDKGLIKLIDLGDYWETRTQSPIPLGGIVAKKSLDISTIKKIDSLIKASVEYAYKNNYEVLSDYVKQHAQEMSEEVMRKHIDLYVNNFSVDLGDQGKQAVLTLMEVHSKNFTINKILQTQHIFID
ncbi:MAG TPA: 1,4-dihydroxy-6-naphthoate synthase [Parafilimonas sp.]|nr:1,4-dihydroxy-6-naphthoate synthase [Parafilimonas sp.]